MRYGISAERVVLTSFVLFPALGGIIGGRIGAAYFESRILASLLGLGVGVLLAVLFIFGMVIVEKIFRS
jgi:hypothetical protein